MTNFIVWKAVGIDATFTAVSNFHGDSEERAREDISERLFYSSYAAWNKWNHAGTQVEKINLIDLEVIARNALKDVYPFQVLKDINFISQYEGGKYWSFSITKEGVDAHLVFIFTTGGLLREIKNSGAVISSRSYRTMQTIKFHIERYFTDLQLVTWKYSIV